MKVIFWALSPRMVYWVSVINLLAVRWVWLPMDDHGCMWWTSLWYVHFLSDVASTFWERARQEADQGRRPKTF